MGWVTVLAYGLTTGLCFRAYRRARSQEANSRPSGVTLLWAGLAALLLLLGINKQLDLQSLLTQVGKDLAHAQGWYEQRRGVQVAFIAAVAGVFGLLGSTALWLARGRLRELRLALVGTAFLLAFVVARAASFHHVDVLLYMDLGGLKLNWVFELSGIACIGVGAARSKPGRPRPTKKRRKGRREIPIEVKVLPARTDTRDE